MNNLFTTISSGYRMGMASFAIGFEAQSKLFIPDDEAPSGYIGNPDLLNTDVFPTVFPPGMDFLLFNPYSSNVVENSRGVIESPEDTTATYSADLAGTESRVNDWHKRMLANLLCVPDKNGFSIPIAGSYFIKLMDHTPGTVQPWSCLITDSQGRIEGLDITGNLSLTGGSGGDADTALNTFGKTNTIDCGSYES